MKNPVCMCSFALLFSLLFHPFINHAQKTTGDLRLLDWRPKSQLVVKETVILKPRYPVIDIHNHLGNLQDTEKYLEEMDKAGVRMCVSLDGRSEKDFYKEHLTVSNKISPDRFLVFFFGPTFHASMRLILVRAKRVSSGKLSAWAYVV